MKTNMLKEKKNKVNLNKNLGINIQNDLNDQVKVAKEKFFKNFGQDIDDIKGKEISCTPLPNGNSSFLNDFTGIIDGIETGFNDNGKEFIYINVIDQEDNFFSVEFDEILEIDGYDYKNLRIDYHIEFKKGFEYQGLDHYSIDEGEIKGVKDFIESYIGEDYEGKIKSINVHHYANHINEETDPIELTGRDYSLDIQEVMNY